MSVLGNRFRRGLRQTLTVARRDFTATVFTPIFLLFLFMPAVILSISAVGGMGAASVSAGSADKVRMVAIAAPADGALLAAADRRLRPLFRRDEDAPAPLFLASPAADPERQARAMFRSTRFDATAVMLGGLERPTILNGPRGTRSATYLETLAQAALEARALGADTPVSTATRTEVSRDHASFGGRNQAAFMGVFGIFFLTLFLAGQVVGTMAEERNNKVIEVLAAAVPLESVFLGKLLGMFGVAMLFVAFWATVFGQVGQLLPAGAAAALGEVRPAVGGGFALLFFAYFAMAYLLLGSVFLGVGAQASTMREIQMLSLPITVVQVGMFALSSAAASQPGTWLATCAEIFPLSSPFAMVARAANRPEIWPHLLALAWQALWVGLFVTAGARLFRRGVLQSGSGRSGRRWFRWRPLAA